LSGSDAIPAAINFPQIDGEPTFSEPWQAQAFALVVQLHKSGHFTWSQWAQALSAELAEFENANEDGDKYYHHWLSALEKLMGKKSIIDPVVLKQREEQWHRAAHATPHGEPILLTNDPLLQS